jgi:serine protease Do
MTDPHQRPARRAARSVWPVCLALACCLLSLSGAAGSELRETPIVKAVQRARGAVVNIRGEKTVAVAATSAAAPDVSRRVNGMGTGVVIDPRGYILTNYHVVDGVKEILVTLVDGRRHVAKLVARDTETDLAIIKIDAQQPLPVVPLGTSSDLMPGETVIAVGNAYGYEHTVTRGIVSALHRSVQVSDAQFYDDLIQTDASINPGNSGGPLLNIDGEMIGVNVAVRAGAQGIGFAIPVDKATAVAVGLLAACNAERTWIGMESSTKTSPQGMVVGDVTPDSPAAEAGLRPGDVLVAVGEDNIHRPLDFQRAMLERQPGQRVKLSVQRGGERLVLELTLGEAGRREKTAEQPAWAVLGIELKPIPADDFRKKYQTSYRGGLEVLSVRPGSPAAKEGIVPGDVLVGMHVWETTTLDNVSYILKRPDFASLNPVKFYILREGETLYGYLPLAPAKTAQRQEVR